MIPLVLHIRVKPKSRKVFGLWLPLFILWLIVLPILAVFAPLVLIVSLLSWKYGKGRLILFSYFSIFNLIFNLSGLKIDVQSKEDNIVYLNLK